MGVSSTVALSPAEFLNTALRGLSSAKFHADHSPGIDPPSLTVIEVSLPFSLIIARRAFDVMMTPDNTTSSFRIGLSGAGASTGIGGVGLRSSLNNGRALTSAKLSQLPSLNWALENCFLPAAGSSGSNGHQP